METGAKKLLSKHEKEFPEEFKAMMRKTKPFKAKTVIENHYLSAFKESIKGFESKTAPFIKIIKETTLKGAALKAHINVCFPNAKNERIKPHIGEGFVELLLEFDFRIAGLPLWNLTVGFPTLTLHSFVLSQLPISCLARLIATSIRQHNWKAFKAAHGELAAVLIRWSLVSFNRLDPRLCCSSHSRLAFSSISPTTDCVQFRGALHCLLYGSHFSDQFMCDRTRFWLPSASGGAPAKTVSAASL